MVDFISTLGLQLVNNNNLTSGQTLLSKLSQQLTTGKYSTSLADYSSSDAQKMMNFNGKINEQKGFLAVINTLTPRLKAYDQTMEGIEDTAADAYSTILSNSIYNSDTNSSLQSTIEGYMDQIAYYLNTQIGERYIYSGSRYNQAPVGDIKSLPTPPTETAPYLATGNEVPAYDTDYDPLNPTNPVPTANVKEQASIDTTQKLTYGVTSNEDGFQQLIMGLRFAYSATKDQANYQTYMATARDLISKGLANTRGTHTDATNAYTSMTNTQKQIKSTVSNFQAQLDNLQNVDVNEVAVKITTLQAQLEASYAATGKIANLSIVSYL